MLSSGNLAILPQLLVNALITGSIYALAGAGLALSYGVFRILNFAHGHFMMLGAYVFYAFSVGSEQGLLVSALATAGVMTAIALVCLLTFVMPFLTKSFFLVFITTLALSTIIESLVAMIFGVNVKSLSGDMSHESLEFAGIYITKLQILIVCTAVLLLSALALIVHCSSFGRRMRALAEHPQAALSLGENRLKTSIIVFSGSVLLASIAGILVGFETNLQPTMGQSYTIKAFAAMIFGGLGNIWGTVLGSYLIGLLENLVVGLDFFGFSVPAGYKDAVAFLVILVVLLIRPQGILGKKTRGA